MPPQLPICRIDYIGLSPQHCLSQYVLSICPDTVPFFLEHGWIPMDRTTQA